MAKNFEKKVAQVFASYPKAKEFHFTEDGQAFVQEADAKNHAKKLEGKEVVKITRGMARSGNIEKPETSTDAAPSNGAKNEFQELGDGPESKGSQDTPPAPLEGGDKSPEGSKSDEDKEREELVERYVELAGKKPAHNIGTDKLKAAVEELEKAKSEENKEEVSEEEKSEESSVDQKTEE